MLFRKCNCSKIVSVLLNCTIGTSWSPSGITCRYKSICKILYLLTVAIYILSLCYENSLISFGIRFEQEPCTSESLHRTYTKIHDYFAFRINFLVQITLLEDITNMAFVQTQCTMTSYDCKRSNVSSQRHKCKRLK